MTGQARPHPGRLELLVTVAVLVVLATIPAWTQAWWTALPFAAAFGGMLGGRWVRWFWALPLGFAAGAIVWGIELALLPADPRSRLAAVLGPAEGVSGFVFLLLGPVLFGVVSAVTALAAAGALRLAGDRQPDEHGPSTSETVPPGAAH
jgi:hypothetical protein